MRPVILNDGHMAISVVRLDVTAPTTTTESPDTPSPTSPNPPPPPGECNDIYFILTIVLASVLGVTLILIICTPIILKFCRYTNQYFSLFMISFERKSRVGKMTGPLSRKATTKKAGVLMSGASFKSFSDMVFVKNISRSFPLHDNIVFAELRDSAGESNYTNAASAAGRLPGKLQDLKK